MVQISLQVLGVFAEEKMEIAAALPLESQAKHCKQVGVYLYLLVIEVCGVLCEPLGHLEASGENTEGMYLLSIPEKRYQR